MALTNKDVEKLAEVFVTKQEFNKGLESLKTELKDQILSGEDRVIKKLEDMSIEQKMAYSQDKRQDERIKALEEKVLVS